MMMIRVEAATNLVDHSKRAIANHTLRTVQTLVLLVNIRGASLGWLRHVLDFLHSQACASAEDNNNHTIDE
jgi:hypothetical protein